MLSLLAPIHKPRSHPTLLTTLRHLGAAGLFFLAILDSSPLPTFGGPDILTAVLAASHRPLWWEYAAAATAGSVVGAYLTFRLARTAGSAYLDKKFKQGKLSKFLKLFQHWGTGTLDCFHGDSAALSDLSVFRGCWCGRLSTRKISSNCHSLSLREIFHNSLRRRTLRAALPAGAAASGAALGMDRYRSGFGDGSASRWDSGEPASGSCRRGQRENGVQSPAI